MVALYLPAIFKRSPRAEQTCEKSLPVESSPVKPLEKPQGKSGPKTLLQQAMGFVPKQANMFSKKLKGKKVVKAVAKKKSASKKKAEPKKKLVKKANMKQDSSKALGDKASMEGSGDGELPGDDCRNFKFESSFYGSCKLETYSTKSYIWYWDVENQKWRSINRLMCSQPWGDFAQAGAAHQEGLAGC